MCWISGLFLAGEGDNIAWTRQHKHATGQFVQQVWIDAFRAQQRNFLFKLKAISHQAIPVVLKLKRPGRESVPMGKAPLALHSMEGEIAEQQSANTGYNHVKTAHCRGSGLFK
jgi:hypothetical protein